MEVKKGYERGKELSTRGNAVNKVWRNKNYYSGNQKI